MTNSGKNPSVQKKIENIYIYITLKLAGLIKFCSSKLLIFKDHINPIKIVLKC